MLLAVLVAVAILMLLYFIDIKAIFGPKLRTKSEKPTVRPWLEEQRIAGDDVLIKMPKAPKPVIDQDFTVTGQVISDDSDRGEINISFNTAGEVSGDWFCEYSVESRDYTFEADFAGNIDITKTYSDKKDKDKSKLYFITKGSYTQTIYNSQTGNQTQEKGTIYTTGWLDNNYTATGVITITTDKSWSASYDFQAE